MSKFYLKVISSNRIFYEGFCTCLIIPSVDGEKAIMAKSLLQLTMVR